VLVACSGGEEERWSSLVRGKDKCEYLIN
jgi:hypothetical protein